MNYLPSSPTVEPCAMYSHGLSLSLKAWRAKARSFNSRPIKYKMYIVYKQLTIMILNVDMEYDSSPESVAYSCNVMYFQPANFNKYLLRAFEQCSISC